MGNASISSCPQARPPASRTLSMSIRSANTDHFAGSSPLAVRRRQPLQLFEPIDTPHCLLIADHIRVITHTVAGATSTTLSNQVRCGISCPSSAYSVSVYGVFKLAGPFRAPPIDSKQADFTCNARTYFAPKRQSYGAVRTRRRQQIAMRGSTDTPPRRPDFDPKGLHASHH